jgi:2-iminobutanoate/2-iminopropanoate deaminase
MAEGRSWQPVQPGPGAPQPAGAYSAAIRAGDLLFVSGQVPKDPETGQVDGDVAQQTRQVLENLSAVLATAGATLADVVAVTVYLADIADWAHFNDVYAEIFHAPYPTRTTVGAGLHGRLSKRDAMLPLGAKPAAVEFFRGHDKIGVVLAGPFNVLFEVFLGEAPDDAWRDQQNQGQDDQVCKI